MRFPTPTFSGQRHPALRCFSERCFSERCFSERDAGNRTAAALHTGALFVGVLLAAVLCTAAGPARADEYKLLSERDFLAAAFAGAQADAGRLAVDDALGSRLSNVFHHRFRTGRIRYWRSGNRTAWLLDETGKEKPISMGVVVEDARIVSIAVLVYRETHGMEVAEPAFTGRFPGAGLTADDSLDRDIDNISGATLSVRAMTHTAAAALVLDEWLRRPQGAAR